VPKSDEIEKWLDSIGSRACFRERLKVYAPVNCGGENEICRCGSRRAKSRESCEEAVEELVVAMNRLFGGSTVYDAKGSWMDGGQLIIEPVKVIEAGHRCVAGDAAEKFAEAVSRFAENSKQSAMAISQSNFYLADTPKIANAFRERFVQQAKLGRFR
jgi:hypothetical protein